MKRLYTKHIPLSNGQLLSVYARRWDSGFFADTGRQFIAAEFGIVIGKHRRANNDWYNWRGRNCSLVRQTGTCGIEGLRIARDELLALVSRCEADPYINMVCAHACDPKRHQAYRYLKRYGFVEWDCGTDKYWVKMLNGLGQP